MTRDAAKMIVSFILFVFPYGCLLFMISHFDQINELLTYHPFIAIFFIVQWPPNLKMPFEKFLRNSCYFWPVFRPNLWKMKSNHYAVKFFTCVLSNKRVHWPVNFFLILFRSIKYKQRTSFKRIFAHTHTHIYVYIYII